MKLLGKKKTNNIVDRNIKDEIRKKNPHISYFQKDSSFIYESRFCNYYFNKLPNKNSMKPSQNKINFLRNLINLYKDEQNKDRNIKTIKIPYIFAKYFEEMEKKPKLLSEREKAIELLISQGNKKLNISCRRLTEKYNNSFPNDHISKSTVYRIVKSKLNYSFRKTSIKNEILLSKNYIRQAYFIIKILLRCLEMNCEIIYLDESNFITKNNNFKTWRKKNELIFHKNSKIDKINLLLAVSSKRLFHFKITSENTDSNIFHCFMEELLSKINSEEKKNYIFFMDNLSSHLTADMFKYYDYEKLKIIFNVPYLSTFNMIELCFRQIKRDTYTHLYESIDELKKNIEEIILSEKFKGQLKSHFKETLETYLIFLIDYNNFNLN